MPTIELPEKDEDSSALGGLDPAGFPVVATELAVRAEARGSTVMKVIQEILEGTAPLPEGWEGYSGGVGNNRQTRLRAHHVNMILDQMSFGMTHQEIANKYECARKVVSFALKHPHAELIKAAVLGSMADRITDPRERLHGYAHEAISSVVSVMRTTKNEGLRGKMALSILDRVGLGAVQKVESKNTHEIMMPAAEAATLSRALSLSTEVSSMDYSSYLYRNPSQGGGEGGEQPAETTDEGLGNPSQPAGTSPSSPPTADDEARVA